jgi:ABC-2 type transport system permease protein
MKKYLLTLKFGFQEMMAYRLQMLLWVVISTLPAIFSIFVFNRLSGNTGVGDVSTNSTSSSYLATYFLLGGVIRLITIIFFEDVIQNYIFNGQLSFFLLKPISFLPSTFVKYISGPLIKFLLALPFVIYVAVFTIRANPIQQMSLLRSGLFLGSLLGGYMLSAAFSFIVGLTTFWLQRVFFIKDLNTALILTFSGSTIPIYFFPDKFRQIIELLPFRFMLEFQINILLNDKLPAVAEFLLMIAYLVILWTIVILMYKKGLKKYEAYGN